MHPTTNTTHPWHRDISKKVRNVGQPPMMGRSPNKVRQKCPSLDGMMVGMDDYFPNNALIPPGHPQCRCVVDYVETPAIVTLTQTLLGRSNKADGQVDAEYEETSRMGSRAMDWNKTIATTHSKEIQKELVEYGKSRNVNIISISKFDGDVDILKEQIDIISENALEYRITEKITVAFEVMDDEDLAQTVNQTITFNTKALRSREVTNQYLNSDDFLSSADIRGIAIHEMGHIISKKYGEKGVETARKAYYNITGKDISNKDLLEYLRQNISLYSVNIDLLKKDKPFKSSYYKEIVPEVLAKNLTDTDSFTKEFERILKGLIR